VSRDDAAARVDRQHVEEALRAATLAGLDEDEVRRLLEAMGARWVSTEAQRTEIELRCFGDTFGAPATQTVKAVRVMRLQWPQRTSITRRLLAVTSMIKVHFDAEGRAVAANIHTPR
jgi:hypothetical protein